MLISVNPFIIEFSNNINPNFSILIIDWTVDPEPLMLVKEQAENFTEPIPSLEIKAASDVSMSMNSES